ncbi:uncharacterized protein AC631_02362 [Debaryomyces fabryi]|uniref:NADH dehydrogenase [ubiquinone] 1 beta subcomplex subunit 8, mitochondrial n=1 Tax=Debaryomyces fabryi TaxID=58627 RepID=A0A0V1Q0G1_9ASCO|nr:uncharacterized protein AC631_02362 [Debaryomyces fabryi]KSA01906.1 hypothetical protein AC631_02362 [Debaryomyces fabryi]CUM53569.1 unnamed protein product [Debaryomyces fabryi]
MLSRIGLNASRCISRRSVRCLTTKNTITDHSTGRVIKLTDPSRPEIADYDNVKPVLAQDKDPYVKYDDQQNRRNINDPLNIEEDYYDIWSPDYFQFVSDKTALKHNGIFFSLIIGFGTAIWYFELNPAKPAMPRSYPFGGLAKDLGAGSKEDEYFYRVKPDTTAEEELGFLANDNQIQENKKAYEQANADFLRD